MSVEGLPVLLLIAIALGALNLWLCLRLRRIGRTGRRRQK